ncbi:nitrate reductase [Thiosulfativibrio zosterae]|uniref:Nitrate reductase n=2 Tax=Thiosulfativibrio zosterae TaxID=2675053 RepID=A0A6F8PNN7_9GAMM|nr:nitrate reductase [Thiosulfativibrio zosterae]
MQVSTKTTLKGLEVKVLGDKLHPANFGKLCVKGSSAGETTGFEGRMLAPQINGETVDWQTAISEVASRLTQIIQEYGPDAVAFYVSGQFLTEDYYVANKLIKGFIGTANIDTNSRLCMASAVVGYKRAFGSDTVPCSYEDLDHADLITIVGSNTAWAHPIVYQRIAAVKKARPNLKVVVIDPRRTATCDIADIHLAIKPGMDAALFNGLLAYLAQNDALDSEYIQQHTEGFEAALAQAQSLQGDLEALAKQCDLPLKDLQAWLNLAAKTPKMVTLYSQGVNQSTTGVDKSNAIINCHLATGRIGKEGAGPFSITGQPNAMGGREVGGLANQLAAHMDFANPAHIDLVRRFWQAPNMAQQNGLKAVDMFNAVAEGKIKAIWIMNTNPVVSMPNADAVKAALQACDTVIVQDCNQHTDTTAVGNILLPALTWGETDGAVTNSDRTLSIQRQFTQGPELARPDWWILAEVAKKMGWPEAFDYRSAVDIFREHAQLSGFENNGSRDFDISAFSQITAQEYADFKPVQWPVNAQHPKGKKRMFEDGLFFTPNRKAKLIAITPQAPFSKPSAEAPFIFNTGRIRDQWHTMTRTAKTPKLMAHIDEPYVTVHPLDAEKLALKAGALAKVFNTYGEYVGRVEISDSQRPGELFAPMHWTAQYASQGRADVCVAPRVDALSGQPESKHSVVNIVPFEVSWHGFILTTQQLSAVQINQTEALDYWAKITGKAFTRIEIAGKNWPKNNQAWAKLSLNWQENQDFLEYEDARAGHYRAAVLSDGRLVGVVFIAPSHQLPSRSWLGDLFSATQINDFNRRSILAGSASGVKDVGKTICACYGVGINTILEAMQQQNLTTVEALGKALKAGTNCGSCVPELTEILASQVTQLS